MCVFACVCVCGICARVMCVWPLTDETSACVCPDCVCDCVLPDTDACVCVVCESVCKYIKEHHAAMLLTHILKEVVFFGLCHWGLVL